MDGRKEREKNFYEVLASALRELGSDIEVRPSMVELWRGNYRFARIKVMSRTCHVVLDSCEPLIDPEKLAKPVGIGFYEIRVNRSKHIPYAKTLVKQAYDGAKKKAIIFGTD